MFKENQVIKEILQVLYFERNEAGELVLNEDKEWDGDTLPAVAEILCDHGLMQFHGISLKPENFIRIIWGIADIQDYAKKSCGWPDMSDAIARDILEEMEHYHEPANGVTWDTVNYYVTEHKESNDD